MTTDDLKSTSSPCDGVVEALRELMQAVHEVHAHDRPVFNSRLDLALLKAHAALSSPTGEGEEGK